MICPNCLDSLIWGGDHDNENYGIEEAGIVSNYTCSNEICEVTEITIYKNYERTKRQKNERI